MTNETGDGDMKKNHDNFKVGRIMIVDDEAELMTALCEALAVQGYETTGFTTGADALKILVEQDYDLLLTDLMMPEMDGIALLKAGLEIDPNLVGIIMTGHGTVQTAVEAIKLGAFDYVLKPFKLNTLLPLLSRAMEVRSLRMENIQLRETVAIHELGKVIAFSSDLNAILNKVADATLQQCTADEVSIMLPTRDGKELYVAVARGGHREYIGERVPMERGIAGWVARNRETVIINGKVDDPRFSPVNPRNDIRAAVSMPMLAGGNLVGVLNVNVTRGHRHMTLGQVKALSILVSIIAPILENTWLNIQIRQAEEKYRSIFENAIEGIYQTTPEGQFITANRAIATMLGYDSPEELMSAVTDIAGQLYVIAEERIKLKQMIEDHGQAKSFETSLYRKDGRIIWVSISIHAVCDKKGELLNYDGIAEDVTARKLAARQQALTSRILETLNRPNEIINLIRDILLLLKEYTGVEAIGIRLREGDDFPYFETNGFPPHFLEAENHLCARDNTGEIIRDSQGNPYLECMCGNIACGRTDPKFPFFTECGSFWTNSTTELLASTSEEDRQARTRNRCNSEGYESVALVPLRSGDEISGLLQLNDSRRDSFTIEMIKFLEGIGTTIGIAVARKRAGDALKESESKYRLLADNVNDVIFVLDMNLNYTYVSPSIKILRGYESAEVLKQPSIETLTPSSWDLAMRTLSEIIELEKSEHKDINLSRTLQVEMVRKDGTAVWTEVKFSFIRDENQRMVGILGITRDISERKRAEEELKQSEERYRSIFDNAQEGIYRSTPGGRIIMANPAMAKIFGYASPEELMTGITDVARQLYVDLEERAKIQKMIEKHGFVRNYETQNYRKDENIIWVSMTMQAVRDEKGQIMYYDGIAEDITARKENVERTRKALGATVQAIAVTVETRDPYTAGHQHRVADLARSIATEMKLPVDQIDGIRMAAAIHDLGKISVPAEILSKPTKLTNTEFSLIKIHSQSGYDILKDIDFPWPIARTVLEHHERMNGSGYPNGLTGDNLLLESRILAVADVVESMSSHRPYRPTLGIDAALNEISKNKGTLYDADAVDACLRLFREKGYQLEGT
jgi:PAS domain S-box-containing protein